MFLERDSGALEGGGGLRGELAVALDVGRKLSGLDHEGRELDVELLVALGEHAGFARNLPGIGVVRARLALALADEGVDPLGQVRALAVLAKLAAAAGAEGRGGVFIETGLL